MTVPFYRPSITEDEISDVVACLKSGWLTTGPRTKHFEQEFAAYLHQKHAVALNSCTAALHLALEAVGVKAGDTVVVPTMTFAASAEVVRYFNAHPLLVDCRESDFNLDVADAERRIAEALAHGRKVTAIIPVHYGGQIGDVTGVATLARRFNLKIIEDAAHCCPAYYREVGRVTPCAPSDTPSSVLRPPSSIVSPPSSVVSPLSSDTWLPVGSTADITCFSFYANKGITTGEGGMACTQNDAYAERMRIMSLHGISRDAWQRSSGGASWYYEIIAPGFKYNLTDIAAAIGIHQLRRADELHRKRRQAAALYAQLLEDVEEIILPHELPDRIHSWHLYVIRLRLDRLTLDRAQVIDRLKQAGITTSVHWLPLHQHPYYRETYGYQPEDFPVAASLYPGLITLPLYPDMTEAEITYVCDTLKDTLARNLKPVAAVCDRRREPAVK